MVSGCSAAYRLFRIVHLCSLRHRGFAMCAMPLDLEFIERASIVSCTNFSEHCTSCPLSLSERFRTQRDFQGFSRCRRCGFLIFDITRCVSVRFSFCWEWYGAVQCSAVRFSLSPNGRVRCGLVRSFSLTVRCGKDCIFQKSHGTVGWGGVWCDAVMYPFNSCFLRCG